MGSRMLTSIRVDRKSGTMHRCVSLGSRHTSVTFAIARHPQTDTSLLQITHRLIGTRARPLDRRYYFQKCNGPLHETADYFDTCRCVPCVAKFPTKRFAWQKYHCTKCLVVGIHDASSNDRTSDQQVLLTNNNLERIFQPLVKPPHTAAVAPEALRQLDAEYCNLVNTLSHRDIVNSLLFLYGPLKENMTKLRLYNRSLERLQMLLKHVRVDALNVDSFVQLMKIFGFNKEEEMAVAKVFLNRLSIEHLSERQLYTILSSAFKAQILLAPGQVRRVEEMLNARSRDIAGNQRLLVALCKAIRQGGPTGSQNFQDLSIEIVRHEQPYNVAASAHVLAFFAEIRLMYPKVVERLVSDAFKHYASAKNDITDPVQYPLRDEASYIYKYKYLDTILWSTSRLRYNYKPCELDVVEKFTREHLPHLVKQPNRLINIMLSLWMLERRLEKELNMCFEEGFFVNTINDHVLWKPKARLHLLVNCIKIESSSLTIPRELLNDINVDIEVSQTMHSIYQIVNQFSTQMKLKNVEMNRPIKGIFTTGVSFRHMSAGSFHIDVLDNSNCLLPMRKPDGLLHLKIRLLKKLGYHSIIIDKNSLNSFEDTVTIIEGCLNTIVHRR